MSWSRKFDDPIKLPDGRKLATLRDAGDYIAKLPKSVQAEERWQNATQKLLTAVERDDGPWHIFAQLAFLRALHNTTEAEKMPPEPVPGAKPTRWRTKRKLKRDE